MSLAKILSRGTKTGVPSIINIIDRQIVQEQVKLWSKRRVLYASNKFITLLKTSNDKHAIQDAFDDLVEEYNLPGSRVDNYLHPSELWSGCFRALYYKVGKFPITNTPEPPSPKSQRIFDVGTFYHRYIQRILKNAGYLKWSEVRILNVTRNITGHADGILILLGEDFILEIKSANMRSFDAVKKNNAPLEQHIFQASIYAKELGIKKILFLYINKNDGDMVEFLVDETTPKYKALQREAYDKVDLINVAVQEKKPPDRICKLPTEDRALKCSFCNLCFNIK
jgi:hypothetical protein